MIKLVFVGLLCVLMVPRLAVATSIVIEGTDAERFYGEPGESVRAVAEADDPENSATATGGNGGSTGFTSIPGGTGGNADSIAQTVRDGDALAKSVATGGFGGPTDLDPGFFARIAGTGGSGGNATATATAESRTNSPVSSSAQAFGGEGGGISAGPGAGDGGTATAQASGTSAGGNVSVVVRSEGGAGGDVSPFNEAAVGGLAADGGDATAVARGMISGSGGSLTIGGYYQFARGGRGGDVEGSGGGKTGAGGSASSTSIGIATGDSRVEVRDQAYGGDGGSMPGSVYDYYSLGVDLGGDGGNAGNAVSRAEGRNAGRSSVQVSAEAFGGHGGGAIKLTGFPDHRAGLPGTAAASAYGESTLANVTVTALQRGGAGGSGGDGADGRDGAASDMSDAVSGSTQGMLYLIQRSEGGLGGWGWQSGGDDPSRAGTGGAATASLSARNLGGGALDVQVEAVGGYGGDGGTGIGGHGGAASLGTVSGASDTGQEVRVSASAVGGHGGDVRRGGTAGAGASVVLDNSVTGSTSGALYLSQTAQAGSAGSAESGGQAGSAGDAMSTLAHEASSATFAADVRAVGGDGGFSGSSGEYASNASDGGSASAEGRMANSAGGLVLNASAYGGKGGGTGNSYNNPPPPQRVGNGSDADVNVEGTTTGDGQTISIGSTYWYGALGGNGGDSGGTISGPGAAGDGGHARSASSGIALGNSAVSVRDRAIGGNGGSYGYAGDGGSAISSATARNAGSSSVLATAEATGGAVGYGNQGGAPGSAAATASAVSTGGGAATAIVFVTGGGGGSAGSGVPALASDAVSGSTSGLLTLEQHILGGSSFTFGVDGGDAQGAMRARNSGGGDLDTLLEIVGGPGSRNYAAPAGDGGRSIFERFDAAVDAGHDLRAALRMQGGDGGSYYGQGQGGNGASVQFDSAVDDFQAVGKNGVELSLELQGGSAGNGLNGDAGTAGSARISINREFEAESALVEASSRSGNGGKAEGANVSASAGADASTSAVVANHAGEATLLARAEGGLGGGGTNGAPGARGGNAVSSASASSDGDGADIQVGDEAIAAGTRVASRSGAFGGNSSYGSGGQDGSDGGDASSSSTGQANGESDVRVFDLAIGGKSGTAVYPGAAGTGGSAASSAVARTHGAGNVEVVSIAVGGDGGAQYGGGGNGGTATLGDVIGTSDTGSVSVRGEAHAGVAFDDGVSPDVMLDNAVRGSTSGALQLTQGAFSSGASRGRSSLHDVVDTQSASFRAESLGAGSHAEVDLWNRLGGAQASVRSSGTTRELTTGRVKARTSLDGADVAIGAPIDLWKASQTSFGLFNPAGYGVYGGADATSESSGIADGRSKVSVHDLAVGGSGGVIFYGEPTLEGGDATSSASGTGSGTEALVSSMALGGAPQLSYVYTPGSGYSLSSGSLVGGAATTRADARAGEAARAESLSLVATTGASAHALSTAGGTTATALAAAGTNQAVMAMSVEADGTAAALARLNSTEGGLLGAHQASLDVLSILDSKPDVPQGSFVVPIGSATLHSLTSDTARFSFDLRISLGVMDGKDRDLFLALEAPDFLDGIQWMDLRLESEAGTIFEEHLEGGSTIADLFDEPVRFGRLPQKPSPQYPPAPIPEVTVSIAWMIDGADGGSFDPTVSFEAVPEPRALALLVMLGVVALFRVRWMRSTGRGD